MSSLEQSDAEAAAVQKTPNRVTLDDIKAKIASASYFTAAQAVDALKQPVHPALTVLTICIVVTDTGFTIIADNAALHGSTITHNTTLAPAPVKKKQ
jgi:hypothetical protein